MANPKSMDHQKKKQKLRHDARKQFMTSISIVGLYDVYYAPNTVIRWMFILAIFTAIGSIFYHLWLIIILYRNPKSKFEILQTDRYIIPFPKVTICAPSGLNQSWAIDHLRFPPREKKMFDQLDPNKKYEILQAVASLMGQSHEYILQAGLTPRSPDYFAYQHIISESFDRFPDGLSPAIQGGMQSCEKTVSNCQFMGIFYDCCKDSQIIVDMDGPCFDLGVDKIDRFWSYPRSPTAVHKLTFDVKMDWNYILPSSTINGFYIHVGDSYTRTGKPIAAPAGTHVMIDVSRPLLRIDRSKCFNREMPETIFGPYDANAHNCISERYMKEFTYKVMGCMEATGAFVPNASMQCGGSTVLPLKMMALYGNSPGIEKEQQNLIYDIFNSKTRCLPLCKAWEYNARPSFSQLIRSDYLTPIGQNKTANITMSQITIYLASSFYTERTEVSSSKSAYVAYQKITCIAQLYFGFSVITTAELVFYAFSLCWVYTKTYRKKNKVTPAN